MPLVTLPLLKASDEGHGEVGSERWEVAWQHSRLGEREGEGIRKGQLLGGGCWGAKRGLD